MEYQCVVIRLITIIEIVFFQERTAIEYSKFNLAQFEAYFAGVDRYQYSKGIERQLMQLQNIGTDILEEEDLTNFTQLVSEMVQIYSTASICPYQIPDCTNDERLDLTPRKYFAT